MRCLRPLATSVLLILSVGAARSAPSFFGDTGLVLTPDALTATRHTVTPQWHNMPAELGAAGDNDSADWTSAGALFGLTDRLEAYLGFFSFEDDPFSSDVGTKDEFVAHIKAQALREPGNWLNLAIGIRNMGLDTGESEHEPTVYAVATKTVFGSDEEDRCLRVSLGLQFANEDDFLNEQHWGDPPSRPRGDFDRDSLWGSAEWRISPRVGLIGEMQETADSNHVVNFGVRASPWEDVAVDLLWIEDTQESMTSEGAEFAFGVSGVIPLDAGHAGAPGDRETSHGNTSPSFFGDTGILLMPNAMTAPHHTVTPVYHHLASAVGDDDGNDIGAWRYGGLLVGTTDRLEVFAGNTSFSDDPLEPTENPEDSLAMHAKAQALREPHDCLNLAVGVRNYGMDTVGDSDNEPSAYIAATKTLFTSDDEVDPSFLRATVGLLLANKHGLLVEEYFLEHGGDDYDGNSLFGGVEWMMGRYVTVLGEAVEAGPDEGIFNFGARLHPCEDLTLDLMFLEGAPNSKHRFAWGASYQMPF